MSAGDASSAVGQKLQIRQPHHFATPLRGAYPNNGGGGPKDAGGHETVLHRFTGGNDGGLPYVGVVFEILPP